MIRTEPETREWVRHHLPIMGKELMESAEDLISEYLTVYPEAFAFVFDTIWEKAGEWDDNGRPAR